MRRLAMLIVTAVAAAGCSKSGPAEVPTNPVPMEKPGAAASPVGGKAGGPAAGPASPNAGVKALPE